MSIWNVNNTARKSFSFGRVFRFVAVVFLVVRSDNYLWYRATIVRSISVKLMGVHRNVFKRMLEQSFTTEQLQQQQQNNNIVDTRPETISARSSFSSRIISISICCPHSRTISRACVCLFFLCHLITGYVFFSFVRCVCVYTSVIYRVFGPSWPPILPSNHTNTQKFMYLYGLWCHWQFQ